MRIHAEAVLDLQLGSSFGARAGRGRLQIVDAERCQHLTSTAAACRDAALVKVAHLDVYDVNGPQHLQRGRYR